MWLNRRGSAWIWVLIILIVVLIAVAIGAYFLISRNSIPPPVLSDKKNCTDSDGGVIFDIKGLTGDVSTHDAYNDVCFTRESPTETTSVTECSGDNCYLKEYSCDSNTGDAVSTEILCKEREFSSCKNGACIN